jgi:hypothetical protein
MQYSSHFIILTLFLFTITFNNNTSAQWIPTDIFPSNGGGVFSLAVSGSNVFAGTNNGGIFLSNNATSWTEVNSGLTNNSVWSFAVSGQNIFAGTYGGGVFLTTNKGTIWTEVNSGLTGTEIYSFAIAGSNIFTGTDDGVFLTTNNGSGWTEVNSGLPNSSVRAMAVSGANLFAAVLFSVYLSTNNGTNWTEVNSGLPNNRTIYSLAISGSNIFAGTNGGGVYLSTNNGTTWTEINSGLTNNVVWTLAVTGTNIFAGTDDGIFLTTDNGSNWINTDYKAVSAYALAVSETQLFAGGGFSRVYRRPLSELITDVELNQERLRSEFHLEQNYPNPFNPTTNLSFIISHSLFVSLKVYDVLGNEVATIVDEEKPAGGYNVTFNSSDLSSGVYFYKLKAGDFVETKKMILLR